MTKQLPVSYLLLPKRYKGTKIIKNKSNIQFYKWPSSYQSVTYCYQTDIRTQKSWKMNPTSKCYSDQVTYCYQRDIRTRKLFEINSTFTFAVTKKLPFSYLLLPKRCKEIKPSKIYSTQNILQWPSSYQSVTYCYQRDIRTQISLKV